MRERGALARLEALVTFHTEEGSTHGGAASVVEDRLRSRSSSINICRRSQTIDLLLSGENGDNRSLPFFANWTATTRRLPRFKHMSGEYATASALSRSGSLASC